MRALIIGYGSIARRHIENLRASGMVGELLVFKPGAQPENARGDLRFCSSVADGIAARPDFAVVASPSSAHIDSLAPLLEAGIACYVEKPPVTTVEDADRLRHLLASRRPCPVTLTGCNLRFLPSLRRMREMILTGKIGRPVRASLQAGQWLPDWRPGRDYRRSYSASAAAGGGVIFDLIHEIDAARWLFGEFDEVCALSGKLSRLEIDAEDTACLLLGKKNGVGPLLTIGLDYVSRQRVRRYEVVAEEGTLTWDLASNRLTLTSKEDTKVLAADTASFDVNATYVAAMREFLTAVQNRGSTSQDLRDGLDSAMLAIRARDSARR